MSETLNLPVVPMRNSVLLPGVSVPISAGRPGTLRAIEAAANTPERRVFAVAQRNDAENVTPETLHTIGTIATIGSVQRGLGGVRLLLEGQSRGIALRFSPKKGYLEASVQPASEMLPLDAKDPAFVALHREVRERAAELGRKLGLPDEAVDQILAEVDEPGRLADLVAGYLDISAVERQALLETLSVEDRLRRVLLHVQRQIEVLSAQEDIQEKVKEELGGRQREVYLREQLKAIQKELGEGEGSADESLNELQAKLDVLDLPEEARKEVDREWARLTRVGRESMESQVIRTYLETIAELPWNDAERRAPRRLRGGAHPRRGPLRPEATSRTGSSSSSPCASSRRRRRRPGTPTAPRPRRRRLPKPGPRSRRRRCTRRCARGDESCSSPVLPASARPRSPSRSRARWGASTSASRSAARATKRTSAATGAPTSAPCPAGSCRG